MSNTYFGKTGAENVALILPTTKPITPSASDCCMIIAAMVRLRVPIEGVKDMLQAKGGAVVLVSSTSAVTNNTPEFVESLLIGDSEKAMDYATKIGGHDARVRPDKILRERR